MGPRTLSPDMKWYCLLTVDQISDVRKVIEAAEAWALREWNEDGTGTEAALHQAVEAMQAARGAANE